MKRRWLSFLSILVMLLCLIVLLAACSSSDDSGGGFIHIDEGAVETQDAQTVVALANPSATPGPSPTPSATPEPYLIPTNAPDANPDTVITRVGTEEITLAEFQKQVRFERWFRLYQLVKLVEKHGADKILDLRKAENQWVSSLFATLADSNGFGEQVQRIMVIDAITLQEAIRRGVEVDPYQFDARVAQFLVLQVGEGGALPPEFESEYAEFIRQLKIYTGMTEEDFRRVVRARTLYSQLKFLISNEPGATAAAQEAAMGLQVQDLIIATEDEADAIIGRLEAGETVRDIAASLDMTPQSDAEWRIVSPNDESLPEDVRTAIFSAQPGDIVGPIETSRGWYVAIIGTMVRGNLSVEELDSVRERYFLNWVESKMDDPEYVEDFRNWAAYIPQEPLPQDVSPLLRDENVIMPES